MAAKKPNKAKKTEAVRTCIASGKKFPKQEMIRFVRTKDGVEVDLTGKKSGRGANMAMIPEYFDQAVKRNAFKRALKLERNLTDEELQKLRSEFLDAIDQKQFRKGKERVTVKVSKEDYEKVVSQ